MTTTAGSKNLLNILSALADGQQGLPWYDWVLIIIVIVLLVYFLWLWWKYSQKKKEILAKTAAPKITPQPAEPPVEVPKRVEPPVEVSKPTIIPPSPTGAPAPSYSGPPMPTPSIKKDDLTIIEGIGPKIASVFQAAGISTFAQLSQTEASRMEQILHEAGLHLADPSTWAEQARLAGEGKMAELKTLQDSLKGGRQV